ncbi:MAG: hypothetical protein AABY33_08560 [Pseudomonadota bacterium]
MIFATEPYKFSLDAFCCWFFVMMLWLPSCVGGWLVYFDLLDAGSMWLGSFVLSLFVAVYMGTTRYAIK